MALNGNNPIYYKDFVSPDNSIEDLIKQLVELRDTYTKSLKDIKAEAIQLSAILQNVSGATEDGRNTNRKAATDADRLAKAQRELTFAESETAREIAEINLARREANELNKLTVRLNSSAEGSYNKLSAQYSINKIYLNNMTKEERENTEEGRKLEATTKAIYEEMKRLQEATGKHVLDVGNYGKALDGLDDKMDEYHQGLLQSLGLNNNFANSLLQMSKNGEKTKSIVDELKLNITAFGRTLSGLLLNPAFLVLAGLAAAGTALKFWFDYNKGLIEATRLTQQFTDKSGDDLKAFRNEVQAVADIFDQEFKDVLESTNSLAKQFGISFDEALKLIRDGFASGADVTGEFLENVREYPAYFKEAGISASQFIAITTQANKSGIFSDKGIDAIKEGNLRIREMTKSTAAALNGIGISSKQVQKELQNGSTTTFEVMQKVSEKLNELPESSSVVGTAIADIFGGPGEDAGLQYLQTLKDIDTNMDNVKANAGELGKLQEEQLRSQADLNNAVSALFDQTGGTFESMITYGKIFINETLAGILNGVIDIINGFAQWYNTDMSLRAILQSIVVVLGSIFVICKELILFVIDGLGNIGDMLAGIFTLDMDKINNSTGAFFNNVVKRAKNAGKEIQKVWDNASKETANGQIDLITTPNLSNANTEKEESERTKMIRRFRQMNAKELKAWINDEKNAKSEYLSIAKEILAAKIKDPNIDPNAAKKALEEIEKAYKKTLELRRRLEDETLKLEKDEFEKKRKQTIINYAREIEDLKHVLNTDKKLTKENKESINQTIKALEKQQTVDLLKIENERQLKLLENQKTGIELRLGAVKKMSDAEKALRLELLENERQTALLQNKQKPESDRQDESLINAKYAKDRGLILDEYLDQQLKLFDQQQALSESEFELLKNSEARKTRFRLDAEKKRLEMILKLNEQSSEKMTDNEVQTIRNTINKIDKEIEESKKTERGQDIYGLFGLNLTDKQKEGISTSVSFAMEQLQTFLDAKIAAADAAVEASEKEVDASQKRLDSEIQARNNGYASNVIAAQKELDLAKKNQEKALKEQRKAQKEQEAIQTLQQIGNLVTASALIWSQLGFPLAIPAIAVMWGSFAASKIKASQLSKKTANSESYGDGTVELLQGGSHASGNDIDLGTKKDGTRRRAEGGEFFAVINKRNSRRFKNVIPDVIKSLNNGTFANKYMSAYDGANGISLNISNNSNNIDDLKKDVKEIRDQNKRRYFVDSNGHTYMSYKNLRRKTKN